jgi:hypothetical protein
MPNPIFRRRAVALYACSLLLAAALAPAAAARQPALAQQSGGVAAADYRARARLA